jgi:alanyl-tRNA synthetase
MNVRKEFEDYYNHLGYICLEEKNIIDRNSQKVQFIISSFDNLLPILERNVCDFTYYTVQRTFRTKNSHVGLWGKDAFLTPFNIMMSSFSHVTDCDKVIIEALEFLFNRLSFFSKDLFCVYGETKRETVENTYGKYLSKDNFICVPEKTMLWKAPVKDDELSGNYIKLYKRHYSGFVLVMDCNIFTYLSKNVVDITIPLFAAEAIVNGNNTIFDTSLFHNIVLCASTDSSVRDSLLFACIFVPVTIALSDGATPNATKEGSSIRKLIRICYYIINAKTINIYTYINLLMFVIKKYCPLLEINVEEIKRIWLSEFNRIEKNNRIADHKIDNMIAKVNKYEFSVEQVIENISNMESTYGIDHRYFIGKLKNTTYNHTKEVEHAFVSKHPTCAMPVDYNFKKTERDFLMSLFIERV